MNQFQSLNFPADGWTNMESSMPNPRMRTIVTDALRTEKTITYGSMKIRYVVLLGICPNGWPGYILQAIANEFGVEIFSEHDEDQPSYVPVGTPTEQEIAVMRAEARAECEALDQEMENLRVTWRGKEITTAS
jgi:hypothetical protein